MNYTTKNINEATYYMMVGCKLSDIETKYVKSHKYANSRPIKQEVWKFLFEDVPVMYQQNWASGKLLVNIRTFFEYRNKLKALIYNKKTNKFVNERFVHHI